MKNKEDFLKKHIRYFLLAALIFFSQFANAWINLENGALTISYTLSHDDRGKRPFKFDLVYNQKSVDDSVLGIGWGSDVITRVEKPTPDGRVIIREYGNGALSTFVPADGKLRVEESITEIITAMGKKANSASLEQLHKQLREDDVYRYAMAREFSVTMKLAIGTVLNSNDLGGQVLTKTASGWTRKKLNAETDHFNELGQLIKSEYPDKYTINIEYKGMDIATIKDSDNRQMNITCYPSHKIKSIETPLTNVISTLKYKGNDLSGIEIKGKDFNKTFDFSYDPGGASNLMEIKSNEGPTQNYTYYPKTSWVKTHRPGNGTEVEYLYGGDNSGLNYWTQIITRRITDDKNAKKDDKNLIIQDYKMSYEKKIDPATGKQWIAKETREEDGRKREVTKNSDGLSTQIKTEKRTISFTWDGPRLMEKRSDDGEFRKYEYNNEYKKLSKVTGPKEIVTYEYIGKDGLLQKASNNKNIYVFLQYNKENLISTLTFTPPSEKEKVTLAFDKYNAAAKPTEVSVTKKGKKLYNMNVTYLGGNYKEHKSNNEKEMINYLGIGLNHLNGLIESGRITSGSEFPSSDRYGL